MENEPRRRFVAPGMILSPHYHLQPGPSQQQLTFFQGVVGAGKSCLTSIIIEDLLKHGEGRLAFFYCSGNASGFDHSKTIRNDTTNIFRCILAQCALRPDGTVVDTIQEAFKASDRQTAGGCELTLSAALSALKDIFQEKQGEQVTLVFDALDECSDYDQFLGALSELTLSKSELRIFVSSRFGTDLGPYLPSHQKLPISQLNAGDISSYVDTEVAKRYPGSGMSQEQSERLKAAIKRYADGV